MARILVIDDNELNRELMARRLARRGHSVDTAPDAEQGLSTATASRPDLILMDIELPRIDGWEATRRLKAGPDTRSIPVIALTAHAMPEYRERSLEAGCDEYESKPVDFPRLIDSIARLLPEEAEA
jgi:two-component system, cell cycle response regulator DivK